MTFRAAFITSICAYVPHLLALAVFVAVPGFAEADTGYKAEYKLTLGPMTVGAMKRHFQVKPSGEYEFESYLRSTGITAIVRPDELTEKSNGRIIDGRFSPGLYTHLRKNKKKPRDIKMTFDARSKTIETTYNGVTSSTEWAPEFLDKLVYQAALMHDLRNGKERLQYTVADRNKLKIYEPVIEGEEVIETAIGTFNALKIVRAREKDQRRTIFWCAPELGYLPIRVAQRSKDGTETIATLSAYETLQREDPIPSY